MLLHCLGEQHVRVFACHQARIRHVQVAERQLMPSWRVALHTCAQACIKARARLTAPQKTAIMKGEEQQDVRGTHALQCCQNTKSWGQNSNQALQWNGCHSSPSRSHVRPSQEVWRGIGRVHRRTRAGSQSRCTAMPTTVMVRTRHIHLQSCKHVAARRGEGRGILKRTARRCTALVAPGRFALLFSLVPAVRPGCHYKPQLTSAA